MKPQTIAITGSSGQVGRAFLDLYDAHQVNARLDQIDTLIAELEQVKPFALINAAAYTAVDHCETNSQHAFNVNTLAVEKLCDWCLRNGCRLIHFSSDYVFDGSKSTPYKEADQIRPLNIYGWSKAFGDMLLLRSQADAYILRTSWVLGPGPQNFVSKILSRGQSQKTLTVINDQIGRTTSASLLAEAASKLCIMKSKTLHTPTLFNVTDSGNDVSWYAIAVYALEVAHDHGYQGISPDKVKPVASSEYETAAIRPKNSRLDCSAFDQAIGISRPHWKTTVEQLVVDSVGK